MFNTFFKYGLLILSFFGLTTARADEGMWMIQKIKQIHGTMQNQGLRLSPEEIYSINNSSLKDAVVSLGGFCTAEVISKEGLLLTNHHCAFDAIQGFSTPENDYLSNGFWAMNRSQEKNIPGLSVSFLVRVEDVTEQLTGSVTDDMTEEQRQQAIIPPARELYKAGF